MNDEFNRLALKQKQALPLEAKVVLAQQRIREWYEHWDGQVYVSFSGGKDSTVLLHLVRDIYPDVPAVFIDTGLEYPEIRKFAMSQSNVTTVRPEMRFDEVLKQRGYPVVSKEVSCTVKYAKKDSTWALNRFQGLDPLGNPSTWKKQYIKWAGLVDAPFAISDECCDIMKKSPAKRYEKETGRKPFVGTQAGESALRESQYLKTGCNGFDSKRPTSKPLSVWLEDDIWEYIRTRNLEYSTVYDQGYDRTGCMFCMFGCHLEKAPNRFQKMKETHPKQYDFCMRPQEKNGLGLRDVLEYLGVKYE